MFLLSTLLQGQAIDPSKKQTNLFITEDTLIIRSVSQANNGVYQCLAKNQVGQGLSNTQTVNVKGKYFRKLENSPTVNRNLTT